MQLTDSPRERKCSTLKCDRLIVIEQGPLLSQSDLSSGGADQKIVVQTLDETLEEFARRAARGLHTTRADTAQIVLGKELTIAPRRSLLRAINAALHPRGTRRIELVAPTDPFPQTLWCLLFEEASRGPEFHGTEFRLKWKQPVVSGIWEVPTAPDLKETA